MMKDWSLDDQIDEISKLSGLPPQNINMMVNSYAEIGGSVQNFVSDMLYHAYRKSGMSIDDINENTTAESHINRIVDKLLV